MEQRKLQDLLIEIIKCVLTQTQLSDSIKQELNDEVVTALFRLAKPQDLAHILNMAFSECDYVVNDQSLYARLQKEEMMALYRCETQKYEISSILNLLDENDVEYIPLKGSYLRAFYPTEYIRTSSDADILVKDEKAQKVSDLICEKLGYKFLLRSSHDFVLSNAQESFTAEIHFSLYLGELEKADAFLENVWSYAVKTPKGEYLLEQEFFITYILAHIAKHFLHGGCGVRPFMDLYIIKNKIDYSEEKLNTLLEKAGLTDFAKAAFCLSDTWFSGEKHTEITRDMQDFIFKSGLYGSQQTYVAMQSAKSGSGSKNIASRFFLPLENMKRYYPMLEKFPVLLPLFWCVRASKVIFRGDLKKTVSEIQLSQSISQSSIDNAKSLRDKLGI